MCYCLLHPLDRSCSSGADQTTKEKLKDLITEQEHVPFEEATTLARSGRKALLDFAGNVFRRTGFAVQRFSPTNEGSIIQHRRCTAKQVVAICFSKLRLLIQKVTLTQEHHCLTKMKSTLNVKQSFSLIHLLADMQRLIHRVFLSTAIFPAGLQTICFAFSTQKRADCIRIALSVITFYDHSHELSLDSGDGKSCVSSAAGIHHAA
jgi:hypothetical protein